MAKSPWKIDEEGEIMELCPAKPVTKITKEDVKRLLKVVDAGLIGGNGEMKPGEMCIEQAISYALGFPDDDDGPRCVNPKLRSLKIHINDLDTWESDEDRAAAMRRIGIAQLDTKTKFNWDVFEEKLVDVFRTKWVTRFLRNHNESEDLIALWELHPDNEWLLEQVDGMIDFSTGRLISDIDDADAVVDAVVGEESDTGLVELLEDMVAIMVEMKTGGSRFIDMAKPITVWHDAKIGGR